MKKYYIIGIIVAIIIVLILALRITLSVKKNKEGTETSITSKRNEIIQNKVNNNKNDNKEVNEMYLTGKHNVEIKIKEFGTIELELDADIAPITVTNFVNLAKSGFYDGLTFHRIISGFMIQGGDPLGNGYGGNSENIKGEFKANGVENTISHTRGTISMARSSKYDSASSQFFIVHEDSLFLDNQYAGFGHVTNGIDIVDKICAVTPVEDNNGTVLKENQPVIEYIKVI